MKNHSYCAPTPPSGQCLECVREDLEAKNAQLRNDATLDAKHVLQLTKDKAALKKEKDELVKEAKFRIALADTWIKQLREAVGEAMDALAADPNHDVALLARLELVRRAARVDTEEKSVFCLEHKKVMKDGVCPKCSTKAK